MARFRPTRDNPLLLLAMDHRASLGKSIYGVVDDAPTPGQTEAMEAGKLATYRGLEQAAGSLSGGHAGVLVDERYGAGVIAEVRRSPARQSVLAVPIEHSGQEWFGLEWGGLGSSEWTEHLRAVQPDYAKVLVRDNPDFDAHGRHAQLTRLRTVSDLLHELGIPLLYELLVPATDAQSAGDRSPGGTDAYDRDVRPGLVTKLIAENYAAGIEPAIWKIEGLETTEAAEAVVDAAHSGGHQSDCIVLGRDAPTERLDHWLTVAAPVEGFVGFAIGRSIWEDAVSDAFTGGSLDAVPAAVARRYLHFAETYLNAR